MGIRKDKVQLSIEFLTDESKAFAKLINETKQFNDQIEATKREIAQLEREMSRMQARGESTAQVEEKLAAAMKRLAQNIASSVETAQRFQRVDLSNVLPSQLAQRAEQLRNVLRNIPPAVIESSDELKAMRDELKAIDAQSKKNAASFKSVAEKAQEVGQKSKLSFSGVLDIISKLTFAVFGLQQALMVALKPLALASQAEQAFIAFETMLDGSTAKARKLVAQLELLSANTPFEFAEVTELSKRLMAMGVEFNKLIPTITALGNIGAGVGKEKMGQLVLAFGQVKAATRLTGAELRQFTEAGVPLLSVLADQFRKNEAAVIKMISAGKVGFADVEKALFSLSGEGGKFAGLMGKQAQTIEGLYSTAKDNLNLALTSFGDGLGVVVKQLLASVITLGNGLDRAKIKEFGIAVGNVLVTLGAWLPTIMTATAMWYAYGAATTLTNAAMRVTVLWTNAGTVATTAWRMAKILAAAAAAVFEGNLLRAGAAMRLLNTITAANPFGLLLAALAGVVSYLVLFKKKTEEQSEAQKAANEVTKQTIDNATKEIKSANDLFAILKDETASRELKAAAVKKLQGMYPDVLKSYKTEKDLLGNLKTAQEAVNAAILQEAFNRIKAAKMREMQEKIIALEIQKAAAQRKSLEAEAQNTTSITVTEQGATIEENSHGKALQAAKAELAGLEGQLKSSYEALGNFNTDINRAFVGMKGAVKNLNLSSSFNQYDAEIQVLGEKVAQTQDASLKKQMQQRIETLKKMKEKEGKELVGIEEKRKVKEENDSKKAESEAKKRAKDELERIQAHTTAKINEYTVEQLKKGRIEKDFEVEILKIKEEGLQKELAFLSGKRKMFVGEYEKTEGDLLKLQRAIRDKAISEALEAAKKQHETTQLATELAYAQREITENEYKKRSIDNTEAYANAQMEVYAQHNMQHTEEYAKAMLQRAQAERQAAKQAQDTLLDAEKQKQSALLGEKEKAFLAGKISEDRYKADTLQIQLDTTNEMLRILEQRGEKESDLYNELTIKKLGLVKTQQQAETDALLEGVKGMSEAEREALNERLNDRKISQAKFDLAILESERNRYEQQLAALRAAGLAQTDEYSKIEGRLTKTQQSEAKKREQIAKEEREMRLKVVSELGDGVVSLMKESNQHEIDMLSQNEEDKKRNADKIKKLRKQQVEIDTWSSIAKIWLNAMEYPFPYSVILGGVQTGFALVRRNQQIEKINAATAAKGQLFDFSGEKTAKSGIFGGRPHAQGGTQGVFSDGTRIEVEADEAFAVVNKKNTPLLRALSHINTIGGNGIPFFANGGILGMDITPTTTITTPSDAPKPTAENERLNALMEMVEQVMAQLARPMRSYVVLDDIEAKQESRNKDRENAAF